MKNVTYNGTEKQVNYAKSLIKELLQSPRRMVEKMEARGIESFNERQMNRYKELKTLIEGIESIETINCSKAISAIKNYNAGGVTNEQLIERIK